MLVRFSVADFPKTLARFIVNGLAIATTEGGRMKVRRTVAGDDAAKKILELLPQ